MAKQVYGQGIQNHFSHHLSSKWWSECSSLVPNCPKRTSLHHFHKMCKPTTLIILLLLSDWVKLDYGVKRYQQETDSIEDTSLRKQVLKWVEKHRAMTWSLHGRRSKAKSKEITGKGPKKCCGGREMEALLAPHRIRPLSRKKVCKWAKTRSSGVMSKTN